MKLKCEKSQRNGKLNTQRKSLGKTRNKDEEFEPKTLFPKSLFFNFSNPRKTPNQV